MPNRDFLLKSEAEWDFFLAFSDKLSALDSRGRFSNFIYSDLKFFLGFDYSTVFLFDEERATLDDFLVNANVNFRINPFLPSVELAMWKIGGAGIQTHFKTENHFIVNFDSPDGSDTITHLLNNDFKHNSHEGIVIPLYQGEYIIGVWILLNKSKGIFKENRVSLLKLIAKQLTVAVLKITAYEKLELQELESSLLQSLNTDFALLREKNELLRILSAKLKDFFNFSHTGIALINEDQQTLSVFLSERLATGRFRKDHGEMLKTKFPMNDRGFGKAIISDEPLLFDLEQVKKTGYMTEYMRINYETGIKNIVLMRLRVSSKIIGVWGICFFEDQAVSTKQLAAVKAIANQLSVAVENIRSNETILAKAREQDLLLKISSDITNVRDKNDLLSVIGGDLKRLLHFESIMIWVLNEDQGYDALRYGGMGSSYESFDKEHILHNIDDGFHLFGKVMNTEDIVIFDLDEIILEESIPAFIKNEYQSGIREKVAIRMRSDNRNVGIFCLNSTVKEAFSEHEIELFKGISYQLSTAISNMIANREIESRDIESEYLLSISMEIATVKNDRELINILMEKLDDRLDFEDILIGMIHEDQLSIASSINDKETYYSIDQMMSTRTFTIDDGVIDCILSSPGIVYFDLEKMAKEQQLPSYLEANLANGLVYATCVRLPNRSGVSGFWMMFSRRPVKMNKGQYTLIDGMVNQITLAISNIIAYREIENHQIEKSKLLSFSNAVALCKTREDLSELINDKFSGIIGNDYLINIINEDGKTNSPFAYDLPKVWIDQIVFSDLKNIKYANSESTFDRILNSVEAVSVNDFLDITARFFRSPLENYACVNEIAGLKLSNGTENLGVVFFGNAAQYHRSRQFQLLKAVCAQVAVAISRINATEKIARQANEKSMLLEFSNSIASVRDNATISKILKKQLNDILLINDFVVYAISDDRSTIKPVLFDADSDFAKNPNFQDFLDVPTSMDSELFSFIFSTPLAVRIAFDELAFSLDERTERLVSDLALKEMIGAPLIIGDENIGLILFDIEQFDGVLEKYDLFKSIMSQITITVANIRANEKVNNQLKQINEYKLRLEDEKVYLTEVIETANNYSEIIGESIEVRKTFKLVEQVAPSDSTVLILGETGTGKELIARAIHNNSARKTKLMVKVNCATLPANLIESELFGHERGSFTGATDRRVGKFELANHGTLFLDEIGEMPMDLQVKLLRVLQEKEIERIGGRTTIKVDVRIIAATNRDLEKEMNEGRFRSDLYYRLNIFPIHLSPLRDRREDIPLLAKHFIQRFSKKTGRTISALSSSVLQELVKYNWPGNIRELEHLIERNVLLSVGDTIKTIYLPSLKPVATSATKEFIPQTVDENERNHIYNTLTYCKFKVSGTGGAAELLGIPSSTLNSKIKRLGITRKFLKS